MDDCTFGTIARRLIWTASDHGLTHDEVWLLLALLSEADPRGDSAPSMRHLSAVGGIHRQELIDLTKLLRGKGIVATEPGYSPGPGHRPNVFHLAPFLGRISGAAAHRQAAGDLESAMRDATGLAEDG